MLNEFKKNKTYIFQKELTGFPLSKGSWEHDCDGMAIEFITKTKGRIGKFDIRPEWCIEKPNKIIITDSPVLSIQEVLKYKYGSKFRITFPDGSTPNQAIKLVKMGNVKVLWWVGADEPVPVFKELFESTFELL